LNANSFIPYSTHVCIGLKISGPGEEGGSDLVDTTGEPLQCSGLPQRVQGQDVGVLQGQRTGVQL